MLDELEQEGKAQQDKKGRYSKVSGKKKKNKIREKDSKAAKEWNSGKEKNRVKKRLTENHFQEDLADMPRYEGTFIGHNKGFGFVETGGTGRGYLYSGGKYRNSYAPGPGSGSCD